MPIPVSNLKFGEIDAKNEEFQQKRYGSAIFANSFQVPPRVDVNEILLGAKFFIAGLKGCGKTALLLHIRRLLSEQGASTNTILFKSGLSENERQQISVGSGFEVIDTKGSIGVQYDYVTNWLWLIYRNLVRLIDLSAVLDGYEVALDLKKIMGVGDAKRISLFSDIAIKKIRLNAKAGAKAGVANAEIAGDLELARRESEDRTPLEIIEICERYLPKVRMHPTSRCILLFDELELFWNRVDQKERDLFLIRDLLASVARVNRSLGESSASFVVYASVRTEVLNEVNRVGPEIARDVKDFGVDVDWNVKVSAEHQPILQIVEAKISASEVECEHLPSNDVWSTYFPEPLYGKMPHEHLLNIAMFKPRLIVSRLNLAKEYDLQAKFLGKEAFEESAHKFSAAVWREVEEELLVVYSPKEVSNIKKTLTAYQAIFSIPQFEKRVQDLSKIDPTVVEGLNDRGRCVDVLSALYRLGALGNIFSVRDQGQRLARDRWAFRDYEEPVFEGAFVIHKSLRKIFQLGYSDT